MNRALLIEEMRRFKLTVRCIEERVACAFVRGRYLHLYTRRVVCSCLVISFYFSCCFIHVLHASRCCIADLCDSSYTGL